MAPRVHPVVRRPETLRSDHRRVITRYLDFQHPPRIRAVARRVLKLPEKDVSRLLKGVLRGFAARHRDIAAVLLENCTRALRHVPGHPKLSRDRQLLLGAYFTLEYSIESAALFNPSIVMHPDQSDLPEGAARFLLSLRATGEGHISSIVFRRGLIGRSGEITFDPPPRYAYSARPVPDQAIEKELFCRKLREMGTACEHADRVLGRLGDPFTPAQLKAAIQLVRHMPDTPKAFGALAAQMQWVARANYELRFPSDCRPAEVVIFPATEYEQRGMEDLRLVRFLEDGGQAHYYGTYTAYDGRSVHPMLLETADFETFHVRTLSGRYARNKGMALFPRKVDGHYLMLSRHDGENLYLLRSHSLYAWNVAAKLQAPREPWELVQIGNCGSPIETPRGWIALTHGVGPMRQYCIGALLLDLADPSRVIGRLAEPLLVPSAGEREGYVPNVLYSCGSMIHNGQLVVPYAMSDLRTSFATIEVDALLRRLLEGGPRRRARRR